MMHTKAFQKSLLFIIATLLLMFTPYYFVNAEEDYSSYCQNSPYLKTDLSLTKKGNVDITWLASAYLPSDSKATLYYELQFDTENTFTDAKTFTTDTTSYTLNKSDFGSHGGTFYFRVRSYIIDEAGKRYDGTWSEALESTFVSIDKTNFPGMYKLLKNGGHNHTFEKLEKVTYDTNADGWLDPAEIQKITMISTEILTVSKKPYKRKLSQKVSSLKGIEYLKQVSSVSLAGFSGTSVDLSKNNVWSVELRGLTAKQITVNSPTAKFVMVEATYGKKIKKIDLSSCSSAVDITAYGDNGTKNLKLPKNKNNLKILSLSEISSTTLNVNSYKNLQQLYLYKSSLKNLKISKCKNLRYLYFYYCEKIKSVNVRCNSKLRGVDVCNTPTLSTKRVKTPKKTKVTRNKGKWWYTTKSYKNDMKNLIR